MIHVPGSVTRFMFLLFFMYSPRDGPLKNVYPNKHKEPPLYKGMKVRLKTEDNSATFCKYDSFWISRTTKHVTINFYNIAHYFLVVKHNLTSWPDCLSLPLPTAVLHQCFCIHTHWEYCLLKQIVYRYRLLHGLLDTAKDSFSSPEWTNYVLS